MNGVPRSPISSPIKDGRPGSPTFRRVRDGRVDTSDVKFYNTRSATLEPVHASDDSVSLYVCGITPYDTTHLGHAFTYATADVLVRHLESQSITVRYVQNVTDIDDDILRKAREVGEDWAIVGPPTSSTTCGASISVPRTTSRARATSFLTL